MSENQTSKDSQNEKSPKIEVTKQFFRKKVWDHLKQNKIACFPSPYGRIPNFKGADEAAAKLLDLEEFTSAKSVEVNPDKPLEPSRILALENGKELYVPIPRLEESLLKKLTLQDEIDVKKIVSRWGIENTGTKIDLNDKIHIDLLVLGSVAVSKQGYRIGKGKGYADLEFALLKEMKAIDDDTVLVTTVHDSQIFDELPADLFKKYDVPIDYILTPTQIIKVETGLPKPEGIFWDLLSEKRINAMQVLQKLKKQHESEGKNTSPRRYYRYKKPNRNVVKPDEDAEQNSTSADGVKSENKYRGRYFRRSKLVKTEEVKSNEQNGPKSNEQNGPKSNEQDGPLENSENIPPQKRRRKNRNFHIDFSLHVSNIEKNVRVRDLKKALLEKGIKPYGITWKGFRGFCYLHYATKNNVTKEPVAIDNVIEIIQELKITPDSERNLNVKVLEPITRIETTDVTAV